jgi:hypothetical protein
VGNDKAFTPLGAECARSVQKFIRAGVKTSAIVIVRTENKEYEDKD